ncbi:MAG: transglutaminase-like domain-containing protein, partial [Planctomycetota bacterium]|nr:transglutaminase-like domain-containing protein [Planctomycetota bacterium]
RVPSSVRTLLRSIPAPRDRTIGGAVAAIRGYFDEFEYTTQPKTGRRPLATFLTTRRGHCELFATVACLYFRVWNIPSRIAGGVRCDEVVDAARGMMQARFRDAHAWVEIATRTRGFAPVDVTPPDRNSDAGGPRLGAREGRRGGAGTGLDGGLDWRDPFSYDARQRSALLRGATAVLTSPIVIFLLTGMLGLVLAAAAVAALRRRERPNRIRAPAGVSRRTLAFYAHFLNECAHAGFRRSVAQTPREFLRSLPAELNQKGRAITQEFERRRYGSPTA